ncbi:hypothetical protein KA478_03830 [Patescibacteria group bacterium]|nr:hypothetical protein [Patescibacteria group bacterium]
MPYQIVWEQVHYKFNYVLLQELISSYYRSLDEAYPRDTKSSRSHGKDARIVKYKSTFHQGLLDAQEGDISEPVMDRLLDKEVDMQHRFAKRVIDAKERKKRMLTYISIYYPDYKLIDSPDAMVQEDIFSFDHNQLENYINTSDDGLLRCCAIWLYAFNAPTMMEFSQRFQKFAPILESHKTFGELVEEELKEVYEPVHFKYAYEQLDMEALYIVLCHCRDAMEDCLGMTRSTNMQFEYSYDNEHMRYSSAVVLALYPEKKEKELPDVYGTYLDMVKDYTARK